MLCIHVLTGARIENHRVHRAPRLSNALADFAHLQAVGQVAGYQQNLIWITVGQRLERCHCPCAQGDTRPTLKKRFGQMRAYTAAGASEPDSSATIHWTPEPAGERAGF